MLLLESVLFHLQFSQIIYSTQCIIFFCKHSYKNRSFRIQHDNVCIFMSILTCELPYLYINNHSEFINLSCHEKQQCSLLVNNGWPIIIVYILKYFRVWFHGHLFTFVRMSNQHHKAKPLS